MDNSKRAFPHEDCGGVHGCGAIVWAWPGRRSPLALQDTPQFISGQPGVSSTPCHIDLSGREAPALLLEDMQQDDQTAIGTAQKDRLLARPLPNPPLNYWLRTTIN